MFGRGNRALPHWKHSTGGLLEQKTSHRTLGHEMGMRRLVRRGEKGVACPAGAKKRRAAARVELLE